MMRLRDIPVSVVPGSGFSHAASRQLLVSDAPAAEVLPVRDTRGRALHDLRISVTDRCNFRCVYCMPRDKFDHHAYVPQSQVLRFEEIRRVAALFVDLGVRKIRLTGGEPLLRQGVEDLVAMMADLRAPDGAPIDLALTTNGTRLRALAPRLRQAGLSRLTVSLDALDDAVFRRISDVNQPVTRVLDGIEAAREAGFDAIKINMVVRRGFNDHQILPLAAYCRERGLILRMIEFMDVGTANGWQRGDVMTSDDMLDVIRSWAPIEAVGAADSPGGVARMWRYADGGPQVGTIASVSHAFCGDCSRARLSTEGRLYACLFASQGFDLKSLLRAQEGDEQIRRLIAGWWARRDDRYSELRGAPGAEREARVEMSYIGG